MCFGKQRDGDGGAVRGGSPLLRLVSQTLVDTPQLIEADLHRRTGHGHRLLGPFRLDLTHHPSFTL